MKVHRRAGAVLVAATLSLSLAPGTAVGAGAQVLRISECQVFDIVQVCNDQITVVNVANTPSGMQSVTAETIGTTDITVPGCENTIRFSSHAHQLWDPASNQQTHFMTSSESTIACGGSSTTCVFETTYTYAGGEVRAEGTRSECETTAST
jgi:hypothetical protein